jgi:hypothetical protein
MIDFPQNACNRCNRRYKIDFKRVTLLHAETAGVTHLAKEQPMIRSLHALIRRNGNMVRHEIARPATVARYLTRIHGLADYQVVYWTQGRPHCVTGEGFLALYEAGLFPAPQTLEEITAVPHERSREDVYSQDVCAGPRGDSHL